jgi:hypothetical protein
LRVTLGKRSLQAGGAELKRRDKPDKWITALGEVVETARQTVAAMDAEVAAGTGEQRYGEHLR